MYYLVGALLHDAQTPKRRFFYNFHYVSPGARTFTICFLDDQNGCSLALLEAQVRMHVVHGMPLRLRRDHLAILIVQVIHERLLHVGGCAITSLLNPLTTQLKVRDWGEKHDKHFLYTQHMHTYYYAHAS